MLLVISVWKWVHHRWKQSQRWMKWNYVFMRILDLLEPAVLFHLSTDHLVMSVILSIVPRAVAAAAPGSFLEMQKSQALTKNLVIQTLWDWGPTVCVQTSPLGDSMHAKFWTSRVMWIAVLHVLLKAHICPITICNPSIYLNRESIPDLACYSYIHQFVWQNWLSSWHLQFVSRGWEWEMRSFLISKNFQNIR